MRIAPLADVKARLSAYIQQSETEGPVVITRNGKAVAVLVAKDKRIKRHAPSISAAFGGVSQLWRRRIMN